MDGKTVLDRAVTIIARDDVDRPLLLTFINESIKTYLIDKTLAKFAVSRSFSTASGLITVSAKSISELRCNGSSLLRLPSIEDAYREYGDDLGSTGTPVHYLIQDGTIRLLPPPADGTAVVVIGEFWPADLTDSTTANMFSSEIPLALIYFGAAEYMDFLQEEKRGDYWRSKGAGVISQWLSGLRKQELFKLNNLPRDPLGNLGYNRRTRPIADTSSDLVESETVYDPGVD